MKTTDDSECGEKKSEITNLLMKTYFLFSAAGKYFNQQNISFLVLEANDYIGGRVKNEMWKGESIPLGASWIHNVNEDHIINQLAVQYNLTYYNDSYKLANIQYKYVLISKFQLYGVEITL